MFTLVKIADTIELDPSTFGLPHQQALHQEINKKYANRVLTDVGLCIALYDLQTASDGLLRPGDGSIYIKCEFRLIIFAPFPGETLVGWISSCTEEGLNVRMEFFDNVFIPKTMLFEGTQFIVQEQAWVWKNDEYSLYLDINEKIRFRVEEVVFDKSMRIVASAQIDGMGLISWW